MTIRAVFMAAPFVLMGWIGVLTVVAFVSDGAPAYVVVFPSQILLENIPESSSILATSIASVTLTSDGSWLRAFVVPKRSLACPSGRFAGLLAAAQSRIGSAGLANSPSSLKGLKQLKTFQSKRVFQQNSSIF